MKTAITTEVMTFDDLPSEAAKDKARQWYRDACAHDNWYETIEDDAKNVGIELKEFDIDSASFVRGVKLDIITSAPEVAETIVKEHGNDCRTYHHAKAYLSDLQALGDSCDAADGSPSREAWEAARKELDDSFIDCLAGDYKALLQQELEYIDSDESIDGNILANEYTFTIDGRRFG